MIDSFYLYILGLAITLAVGYYYAKRWEPEDPKANWTNERMKKIHKATHKFPGSQ